MQLWELSGSEFTNINVGSSCDKKDEGVPEEVTSAENPYKYRQIDRIRKAL